MPNTGTDFKRKRVYRVYIAGPMTGYKDFNFPSFNAAEDELKALGFEIVNPAKLANHTDRPWNWYMRNSLKAMLDCDAICLLKGWQKSRGAKLEAKVALELGFKLLEEGDGVFYPTCNATISWLRKAL